MLNESLNLNNEIFDGTVKRKAVRDGYGEGLVEAGNKNPQVVVLCADLTESTRSKDFKNKFPERFVEMGIQEQSMASVASGMAAMGKIPFINSFAVFSPGRNWEQVRTTICYNNSNVKIGGHHAGLSAGPDGATHQALEDIAILRAMPNISIISPCDANEAKKAVIEAAEHKGPVYIRISRAETPVLTTPNTPFKIGRSEIFYKSKNKAQVGIIASGPIIYNALVAARELDNAGIGVNVLNLSCIKPLSDNFLLSFANGLKGIITVEEHQKTGGIGGAISELLSKKKPTKIYFIGIDNSFGQTGRSHELVRHYKLDAETIIKAAKEIIK